MEEHESLEAVRKACGLIGLDSSGAEPIRLAENAMWRLPSRVVVRVGRSGDVNTSRREVLVASWLKANQVSAVVPLQFDQPIQVDGRPVSFWEELPPHQDGGILEVAQMLKQLHVLPPPVFLKKIEPLRDIPERIRGASSLTEADQEWLLQFHQSLQVAWNGIPEGLPDCVIHGDAWVGNCVVDGSGRAYLLDFERTAIGPPEWDLVSTAIDYVGGCIPEPEYRTFCEAYGMDVTQWGGYETFQSIRELRMTAWGAVVASQQPRWRNQVQYRVECLQGKHGERPWRWATIL